MVKLLLILGLPLLLLAGPALAEEKPTVVGQYVDLQPVALPIIVNGQLMNYVFVYLRVNLTGDVSRLRSKEPFFRDALVREAYRTPFVIPGDWQRVDERKLNAIMLRDARSIVGAEAVSSVIVTSQAPQRRVAPPRPIPAG
jgi:hypothetical protein